MTDYHQRPERSSTVLKAAVRYSNRKLYYLHFAPDRPIFKPSEDMRKGSFVDAFITQPHMMDELYVRQPDFPKRPTPNQLEQGKNSKPGTKAHDNWKHYNDIEREWLLFNWSLNGREVVPDSWFSTADAIRHTLNQDPTIGPIISQPLPSSQQPHYWEDPDYGPCRYMPDIETETGLYDLKKTRNAACRPFDRDALTYGYDIQMAHYREGFCDRHGHYPKEVGFITYEWEPPYDYSFRPCSQDFLDYGKMRREIAFCMIKKCQDTELWPSHGNHPMNLP